MKRNLDFTRSLLLAIEASDLNTPYTALLEEFGIGGEMSEEADCNLRFHLHILRQAGYIDGHAFDLTFDDRCPYKEMADAGLTWDGSDFLDAIRPQPVFEQVKSRVSPLGSVAFEVVKALGIEVSKKLVGL